MKTNYTAYAQAFGASDKVIYWLEHNLTNYLKDNEENQGEIEHIIDFLVSEEAPVKMEQMSYPDAKKATDKWVQKLQKQANKITELPEDTEVVLDFKDGFKIVQLVGKNAYEREGNLMRHCVASYYGRDTKIYSLRDAQNSPHCTIEQDQQIKGKGNGSIHPKYIEYVVKFLEWSGMEVRDSEMLNLGYVNVEKHKKYIDTSILFQKKYWFKEEPLLDKDGNEFASLDLLDQAPLIDSTTIKLNFNLKTFIPLAIDFLFKTTKVKDTKNVTSRADYSKVATSGYSSQVATSGNSSQVATSGYSSQVATSGNSSQVATSGNSSQVATSGYSSQVATSGNSSQVATSGDYSKVATSGDYSKVATSGYSSQVATSGNSSQVATSGNSSQVATSGDYSQVATSGDSSQVATSGDYSKVATSGYSSQVATSGDYSKVATSGDYSKVEIKGSDSVGVAIGIKSTIKASLGSWITLAEYDSDYKPVCVKSAQIDGKKLKPGVFYQLKNKKFVEVTNEQTRVSPRITWQALASITRATSNPETNSCS